MTGADRRLREDAYESKSAVSIIGGADGPTSIFIAGETGKRSLKVRIRNIIYKYKRRIVETKVSANAHTLEEFYHLYELKNEVKYESGHEPGIDGGYIEMGIDYIWNILGISYSGGRKARKRFEKISRDLYVYYGVSEEDIRNKTERYSALVTALSS